MGLSAVFSQAPVLVKLLADAVEPQPLILVAVSLSAIEQRQSQS